MDPVIQNAIAERDSLRKQREAIDKRLAEIEQFVSLYGQFAPKTAAVSAKVKAAAPKGRRQNEPAPAMNSSEVVRVSRDILADNRHRPTRALLGELRLHGVAVRGATEKAQVINLSQVLGRERDRNKTFKLDRARGWTLEKAPKTKGPVDVGASTGPESRGTTTLSTRESPQQA